MRTESMISKHKMKSAVLLAFLMIPFVAYAHELQGLTCLSGQVAKWDGSVWICANDDNSGGDITSVNAGSGLSGGGSSNNVSLQVSVPLGLSGNSNRPIISGKNTGSGEGVYGASDENTGVAGESKNGFGVVGFSATGHALYGKHGTGNEGAVGGDSYGVIGVYERSIDPKKSGSGVYGKSNNGNGVRGESKSGPGVLGISDGNYGVSGSSSEHAGIYGRNSESGRYGLLGGKFHGVYGHGGVTGISEDMTGNLVSSGHLGGYQFGVSGSSHQYGVFGRGNRIGVWGMSYQGKAGHFDGDVQVYGTITAWEKEFAQPHPSDPKKEIIYASMEAPESIVVIRGTGRLAKGEVVIETPEHFRLVAEQDVQVQVTPLEDCNGLFVIKKSKDQIVVRELMGGKSNARFDFLVTAPRAGFEKRKVIVENVHFRPQPYETSEEFERRYSTDKKGITNIRNLLIANGILTKNGKLNKETVRSAGWDVATKTSIPELKKPLEEHELELK